MHYDIIIYIVRGLIVFRSIIPALPTSGTYSHTQTVNKILGGTSFKLTYMKIRPKLFNIYGMQCKF